MNFQFKLKQTHLGLFLFIRGKVSLCAPIAKMRSFARIPDMNYRDMQNKRRFVLLL